MNYTIKITCQGGRQNHIGNKLVKLDDRVYATRKEACEAIYAALHDTIQDYGCEMVDIKPYQDRGMVYYCDRAGNNAEPLCADDRPYSRDEALNVDLDDESLTLREVTADDDVDTAMVDYVAVSEDGEIVGYYQWRDDDHWLDDYMTACWDYILREGWATEDGVTATVEEIGGEKAEKLINIINAHPELHAEMINGIVEVTPTGSDPVTEPIDDYVRRIAGEELFKLAVIINRDNDNDCLSMEVED